MLQRLINKVLGTGSESILSAFIQEEIGKPMLAHPSFLETYVKVFLRNDVDYGKQIDQSLGDNESKTSVPAQYIAESRTMLLSIDGAMVSKEMSVPCARSPVSYEAIRHEFSEAFERDDVDNIVARFSSGGGVASRNSDIADFIYDMRGMGKRMIAVADDAAYSAAFNIYSAFPERYVSRSGGLGSVGVVLRHQNNSEHNKKNGVAVTYLYKGDKKVFGNPDEPLSDAAKDEIQSEIDDLYQLFTNTVARNLNISVQSVIETQAGTFMGQKAIDVGFADKIGTLESVLDELKLTNEGNQMSDNLNGEGQKTEAEMRAELESSIRAEIKEEMDAKFEAEQAAIEAAKNELEAELTLSNYATDVKAVCEAAGITDGTTQSIIESNMPLLDVKAMVAEMTTDRTLVGGFSGESANAIASSWDKALAK